MNLHYTTTIKLKEKAKHICDNKAIIWSNFVSSKQNAMKQVRRLSWTDKNKALKLFLIYKCSWKMQCQIKFVKSSQQQVFQQVVCQVVSVLVKQVADESKSNILQIL